MNIQDTYNELIYLVIDGEASDVERTTFYTALAGNPELQNEFQTAMKMNRAAEGFPKKSIVPIAVSDKLFNKAGLTYISADTALVAAAGSAGAFVKSGIFSNIRNYTISKIGFAIFGLILGAGLMYLLNDKSDIEFVNNYSNLKNGRKIEFTEREKAIPLMSSVSGVLIPKHKSGTTEVQTFQNDDKHEDFSHLENEETGSKYESTDQIYNSQINQNLKVVEFARSNNISGFDIQNRVDYSNKLLNFEDLGLSIEVRNSAYWNMANENVLPSEISKFHNMSLSMLYELFDNFKVGAEIRQETFYVKYLSTDGILQNYIYEQQPNLTSIGALLRYTFLDKETFKMFAQNNVSANYYGLVYRGSLGMEYYVIPQISILGAVDFAGLYYQHQKKTNTSEKVGFSYGINFKF